MPFTVNYRGLDVQCETVDDLNRLVEGSEVFKAKVERKAKRIARAAAPRSLFVDSSIRGLIRDLKDNQRALMVEISRAEKSDADLRALLHLSGNKALAGVLSGISKAAKRIGLDEAPIEKRMSRSGSGEREYLYSIRADSAEEVQRALLNGHA